MIVKTRAIWKFKEQYQAYNINHCRGSLTLYKAPHWCYLVPSGEQPLQFPQHKSDIPANYEIPDAWKVIKRQRSRSHEPSSRWSHQQPLFFHLGNERRIQAKEDTNKRRWNYSFVHKAKHGTFLCYQTDQAINWTEKAVRPDLPSENTVP